MAVLWLALALLQSAPPAPIDLPRLLAEMADRTSLARLPEPGWSAQVAGSGREDVDVSAIPLLVAEGPGAITCITTSSALGKLSIWIDDAAKREPGVEIEPTLVIDWSKLKAAKASVGDLCWTSHSDASFHVPIPFARRARVEADAPGCRVDWRRYPSDSSVTPFSRGDLERHRSAIERADRAWRENATSSGEDTFTFLLSNTTPEGELLGIGSSPTAGPRAVSEIRLRLDGADVSEALRHCTLRMTFDGEETVAVPLGAFFGCQDEMSARRSWFVSMEPPGNLVARWVMPYRERMTMRIDNAGDSALHIAGLVRTIPWTWDERSMHFHATWRAVAPSKPMVIAGRGRYVGELVAIASAGGAATGDAGATISADGGDSHPVALGPASGPPFDSPLRGFARSVSPGRFDAWRLRMLDAVPFANSLRHLQRQNIDASEERAACILWYARPGAKTDAPALPRDPAEVLPAGRKR